MNLVTLILAASIKGSVLLALAWGVTRGFKHMSAAARHLVWTAALGGMLIMPALIAVIPKVEASFVPRIPETIAVTTTTAPAADSRLPDVPASGLPSAPAPLSPSVPATRSIDLASFLPFLWAAGAILLLLRLAMSTARVSFWTRKARPVEDGAWLTLVQRLAQRLGIARPITLLRSARACVPMTWGVVYPTVLLPVEADDWTSERRTIVLMHELAHVKRLDAFTQLVAQFAMSLFWFNPLVWLAVRQMRTEREHACDDFVLQGGARASDYASDLLQIARSLGSASAPAAAALAMARRSEFEGRLLAILDPRTDRRSVSRARLAFASLGVVILALPLAALTPIGPRVEAAPVKQVAAQPEPFVPHDSAAPRLRTERATVARRSETPTPAPAPTASLSAKALAIIAAPNAAKAGEAPPDRETLIAVARAAGKMTSSYDKAELLISIAKYYVPDDELRTIYLDAVSTMASDYDRSRTLGALLDKETTLPPKAVGQVVAIAAKMTSDYEKANIVAKTFEGGRVLVPEARTSVIGTIGTIASSYDRRRAITAFVKRGEFNADDAIGLINAAGAMNASYDKAEALIEIAGKAGLNDAGVRKAYFKAAETISSSTDYRRAMAAILK